MKENRIPIGKKKENIEKIVELKKSKFFIPIYCKHKIVFCDFARPVGWYATENK